MTKKQLELLAELEIGPALKYDRIKNGELEAGLVLKRTLVRLFHDEDDVLQTGARTDVSSAGYGFYAIVKIENESGQKDVWRFSYPGHQWQKFS
jgi:hypothetical protein